MEKKSLSYVVANEESESNWPWDGFFLFLFFFLIETRSPITDKDHVICYELMKLIINC
jgi:hypothetical protein